MLRNSNLGQLPQPLIANLLGVPDASIWRRYLPYLDGAKMEAFAVDWKDGSLSPVQWEVPISLAMETQAQGKMVFLIGQGDRSN